jgi:hypothetical protein
MAAQIRGDEKSGTAAQTPSLIDLEISRERTETAACRNHRPDSAVKCLLKSGIWHHGAACVLDGVEGVRGHPVRELRRYLGRREIVCEPIGRCRVEPGFSPRVVLFNGGGRATTSATPDLRSLEEQARWGGDGRRTVEQTRVIDIGTLRRAGYVGQHARDWWKWRNKANGLGIWPKSWRDGFIRLAVAHLPLRASGSDE